MARNITKYFKYFTVNVILYFIHHIQMQTDFATVLLFFVAMTCYWNTIVAIKPKQDQAHKVQILEMDNLSHHFIL